MANHTTNLNLYEIDKANDVFNTFDIDTVLNDNWEIIDENLVNKDGTVAFEAEQIGIDPTNAQGLATKHYVDNKVSGIGIRNVITTGAVNSSGNPDILSYSGNTVSFNVSSTYPLKLTTYEGESLEFTSISGLNIPSTPVSSTFNIFIKEDGTAETFNNTITVAKVLPSTPSTNDVCFLTSVKPLVQYKYNGTSWVEYTGVYCGNAVTNASGAVSSIVQPEFNQNGYDVNFRTEGYRFPDFANGISKSINTIYQAECDGWLYAYAFFSATPGDTAVSLNTSFNSDMSNSFNLSHFYSNATCSNQAYGGLFPVSKGMYYKASTVGGILNTPTVKFYPAKGKA